jgi:hypothetical protein
MLPEGNGILLYFEKGFKNPERSEEEMKDEDI